jgi:hypothetical protein
MASGRVRAPASNFAHGREGERRKRGALPRLPQGGALAAARGEQRAVRRRCKGEPRAWVAAGFRSAAALHRGGGAGLESGEGARQGSGVAFIGQGRERKGRRPGEGRELGCAMMASKRKGGEGGE